ncbi:MAG: MFS transporter [Defluviicoccus sp.]
MEVSNPNRLTPSRLAFYALPAIAFAMPTIPVYIYLPAFYASELGLGLAATGLMLVIARAFDVVTDPLIGILSDRWSSRFGRRKPWIIAGALIAAVAVVQLFQPPVGSGNAHLLIWLIALSLGWTMIAVPYTAWGAELSDDYHERARATGAREAASILGIVLAGAVPASAIGLGFAERDGLAAVAWLAVAVGGPSVLLLALRVPDRAAAVSAKASVRLADWRQHLSVVRNAAFLRLLAAWLVNGLANGLPAVLFAFYLDHALKADAGARGVLIMSYFLAGIAAIPLWVGLSRRYGKHRIWCAAMLLACAAFVWVPFLGEGAIVAFFIICIVTGAAFGADLALPPAMQADVVDLDTLRTRKNRAGWYFALWSMSTKAALAAAAGIAFGTLALAGFDAAGTNSRDAIVTLTVLYALVPTVLKLGAVALIWGHPITARRQTIIRRRISALAQRTA